jgi:hypothetical protein
VINALVDSLVETALEKSRNKQDKAERNVETLLDHLIHETRDPKVLKDEVLNVSRSSSSLSPTREGR